MFEDLTGADSLHIADYAVFVLMLLVSATIGLYYAKIGRRQPNTQEFLTGGRKLTALPVSLSLTASVLSSVLLISIPVEVYRYGAIIGYTCFGHFLAQVFTSEIFLPVFYRLPITSTFQVYCFPSFDLNPLRRHTFWTIAFGGTLGWIMASGTSQTQVQRYNSCKSITHARIAVFISVLLPYLVMDILKGYPGLPGLFLAAVYSGTLSTVSSIINTLAAVTVEDLIKPNVTLTDRQLLHISRALSTYLICSQYMARTIIGGVSGSPMFGLFVLGILCPFANSTGGLFGLAFGFAASLFVSIGSMLSYADPEMTRPLSLSTEGCNFTTPGSLNWTTALPTQMNSFTMAQVQDGATHLLARNWHSPSYLYFSVIGFITTVIVGVIVSLYTGGLKQKVDPSLMLMKEDTLSYHLFKLIKYKVTKRPRRAEQGGTEVVVSECCVFLWLAWHHLWGDHGSRVGSSPCNRKVAGSSPGLDSLGRCVLGQDTSPATYWWWSEGPVAPVFGSLASVSAPQGGCGYM
ncbi:transmembrane protein 25 [Sarotherodon galilaeus]